MLAVNGGAIRIYIVKKNQRYRTTSNYSWMSLFAFIISWVTLKLKLLSATCLPPHALRYVNLLCYYYYCILTYDTKYILVSVLQVTIIIISKSRIENLEINFLSPSQLQPKDAIMNMYNFFCVLCPNFLAHQLIITQFEFMSLINAYNI